MRNSYSSGSFTTPRATVLSPTHAKRWDTLIQNSEVIGLQKEIIHLEKKSQERALSQWEIERLNEVRNSLAEIAH